MEALFIPYEIYDTLFRIQHNDAVIRFMWIPAHRGREGNEMTRVAFSFETG